MSRSKEAISLLPINCDLDLMYVYMLWDSGLVVYVGKSGNIKSRIQSHLKDKNFNNVTLIECLESEVNVIESQKIRTLKPKYNKKDNPDFKKQIAFIDSESEELATIVQKAAIDNNINGVMAMAEKCGLTYERTRRVWIGSKDSKLKDVDQVLDSLGLVLTCKIK